MASNTADTTPPAVRQLFQFTENGFIENIAARADGTLLLTSISQPVLFSFDPHASTPVPQVLCRFPDASGCLGIAETAPDVYAVIAGSLLPMAAVPGTLAVWSVDLRSISKSRSEKPIIRKISVLAEADKLNGMTALGPAAPGVVLIADSGLGAVWRLDTRSGEYRIAVKHDAMAPRANTFPPLGINGLRPSPDGRTLYFTNSAQGFLARVPLTPAGDADGDVEIVSRTPEGRAAFDDFALDGEGNAWVATHHDALTKVSLKDGEQQVVVEKAGNAPWMQSPTSAAFGRGKGEAGKVLYVVSGGPMEEVAGKKEFRGQVMVVDTHRL